MSGDITDGMALSLIGDFEAGDLGLFEEEDGKGAAGTGDRIPDDEDEDEDDDAASIVLCAATQLVKL